jgi:riboflavin kinase / FMN adenylyltransferase
MDIIRTLDAVTPDQTGSIAAIGNFDGVHLGHRAVIGEAGRLAKESGHKLSVLTFEPHPRAFFQPDGIPFRLTSSQTRAAKLASIGIDLLFELPFDRAFAEITAEDFVDRVLFKELDFAHVVVGYDFNYGHRRRGTPEMLVERARASGRGATRLDAIHETDGAVYSSTRARQCLMEGDPRGAASILGSPWDVIGVVERGDQRGRTIGFPTANLRFGDLLTPHHGVYSVRAKLLDEPGARWMPAVANVGRRPTVNDRGVLLEVHLLDREMDLYDRKLAVRFFDFIRPEKKFDGLDALKAQISSDAERARSLLAG